MEIAARSKQQTIERALDQGPTSMHLEDRAGKFETPAANGTDGGGADRRARVNAYNREVFHRTGKRITRADIWRSTSDRSRAEFERWESYWYEKRGKKTNASANARFTRILTAKPHLK
jgi:hypothetical protein